MIYNEIIYSKSTRPQKISIDFDKLRSGSDSQYCTGYKNSEGSEVTFPLYLNLSEIEQKSLYTPSDLGLTPILVDTLPAINTVKYLEYPPTVTDYGDSSYIRTNDTVIESIVVNDNALGKMKDQCYSGCTVLRSIHLPNGATSISYQAFNNCNSLLSIEIPENVIEIFSNAFNFTYKCTSIKFLGNAKCTHIDEYVFTQCGITSIELPNTVTYIGTNCFADCWDLETVTLSDKLEGIPTYCFTVSTGKTSQLKTIKNLPSYCKYIDDYAFANCTELETFPQISNLERIGVGAFINDKKLTGIVTIPESITSIPNRCFEGCNNIEYFVLHNKITSIGDYAFMNCKAKGLFVPAKCTQVGKYAFFSANIDIVEIRQGTTEILEGCLSMCNYVKIMTLPDSLISIGANNNLIGALCGGMDELTLPKSLTLIDTDTSIAVKHLICTNLTPPTLNGSLYTKRLSTQILQKITVPKGSLDTYKTATKWSNYADYMVESET